MPAELTSAADFRRQRLAAHLHGLGARAMLEALREVAAGVPVDAVLARFSRLDPEVLRALGGDRFPARPLHLVSAP